MAQMTVREKEAWLGAELQLVFDLFPSYHGEATSRDTGSKSLRLGVALPKIRSVFGVLLVQTILDKFFDLENGRRVKTVQLLQEMFPD